MITLNKSTVVQIVGNLLVFIGFAMRHFTFTVANYIFTAGAAILLGSQIYILMKLKSDDIRTNRIARLMLLVTAFLGVGAYFMFTGKNTWIPLVLAYALTTLFLSFRGK